MMLMMPGVVLAKELLLHPVVLLIISFFTPNSHRQSVKDAGQRRGYFLALCLLHTLAKKEKLRFAKMG